MKFVFTSSGKRSWTVDFEDGYKAHYSEPWLRDRVLEDEPKGRRFSQLDYILVSKRWVSSVVDAKSLWGPSIHRNIYGKSDHALVLAKWGWKVRAVKSAPRRNWDTLDDLYVSPESNVESQVGIGNQMVVGSTSDMEDSRPANNGESEQHEDDRTSLPKNVDGLIIQTPNAGFTEVDRANL